MPRLTSRRNPVVPPTLGLSPLALNQSGSFPRTQVLNCAGDRVILTVSRREAGLKKIRLRRALQTLTFLLAIFSTIDLTWSGESVNCRVRVLFPGQVSIAEALSQEIRATKSKLLLSLYNFNNPALADELMRLAKRGVKVVIKIDTAKSTEKKENRLIKGLKTAGVSVQAVATDGRNHNKFAVIDDSKVITGSYNWTSKAESNLENVLILDCPELAKKYEKEWESIR